ncbi:MAG TPA: expansin EXLX1 family cellulose-binding protein [Polyangia bacterium]
MRHSALTSLINPLITSLTLVVMAGACRSERQQPGEGVEGPNMRNLPPPGQLISRDDAAAPGGNDGGVGSAPPVADAGLPSMDARTIDLRPPTIDLAPPDRMVTLDAMPIETAPPVETAPPAPPAPVACMNPTVQGEVGVYDIGGGGNCSFPGGSLPTYVVSVDQQLYAGGSSCGTCLEITHGANKIIAHVVDQIPVPPGPKGNRLSLGRVAFDKLTGLNTGLIGMPWRRVPCPTTGPITAALKNGSSVYYWEVIFQNVSNPIATVEFMNANDTKWTAVKREQYNYFRQPSASGLPARFRLTDVHGNVITSPALSWQNPVTQAIPIGVQFPPPCVP